jgi:hypothetical protein
MQTVVATKGRRAPYETLISVDFTQAANGVRILIT